MRLRTAIALLALQIIIGAAYAQIVTEFSAGITQAPEPRGIALGPDGNVWFTEFSGNRIGRITPTGVITEFSVGISPGAGPSAIVTGPDGNLWFVERNGNRIGRITPAGVVTEFSAGISAGATPTSIAVGPDSNLWFTEFNGNRIGRIIVLPANGVVGTITEFSAGISAGAGPGSIIAGLDGNLWFAEYNGNRMAKITTAGVVTEYSAGISAGSNPNGVALGPDGNVWFTEITGNRVAKITPAGVVTEYSAGISAGAGPRSIWPGPDGNLWFTETAGNRMAKITTAGVVTEYSAGITAGSQPWNLVAGPDGNIWFTEFTAGQIGQITTAGVVTEFSDGITPGARPRSIAAGPDGNLWFTESSSDAIGRITPAGVVTQFSAGITPGARPFGITAGPDGNLWFTELDGNRIGRITPAGVVTEFSAGISAAASPWFIARGPDDNLWFTEFTGNRIGRITPAGVVTEFSIGMTAGAGPASITAGPDGNLWFTQLVGNRIGRITTVGVITEFSAGITPGGAPLDITNGPDGNLWFTYEDIDRVAKITTAGTVTEFSAGISGGPAGIVTGLDGNLWFTEESGNKIARITPAGVVTTFGAGITAGAEPFKIAVGSDGNLWFTEPAINRIGRFLMPAATYVVTNNNDSGAGSLRDALQRANADPGPNTVTFDAAVTGTITLTSGQIAVNDATSIVGPGAASLTIDGNANNRIFSIFATDPACPALDGPDYLVSISGLRLTNARRTQSNSGGAIFSEHSLALDAVTIDNSTAGSGGGVYFLAQYAGQAMTITNSQFLNNKAQPIGPGPSTSSGGALAAFERCAGVHVAPVVNISGSVFSGNQSLPVTLNGLGGAIHTDTIGSVTITDTRIVNNQVILPNPPVATQIYRSGGLHAHAKTLRIERSEISDNSLVDATASDLTRGGGLSVFNTAADLQGLADTMSATIVNSTISGNSSPATGGAMAVSGNIAVEIDNSTVVSNSAPQARTGGITFGTAAGPGLPSLTLVSSILANNSSDGGDIAASVASYPTFTVNATNSLIETICPLPSCNIIVSGAGNLLAVDPVLGPLANNGGSSRTHKLLAGSPALNTGSNPLNLTTDQRGAGFARVAGAVADMGAYEAGGAPPVAVSAKSRRTHGLAGTFDLPLSLVSTAPTTEPRQGPAQTIVITFDKPLNAATVTITEGTATAAAPTFSGNDVVVALTGVTNQQYVTVALSNVAAVDGGTGGSASVRIGFLAGDVNGSRAVSVADLGQVNAVLAQSVSVANFLKDVNASGTLTVGDKGITNSNLTKFLPAP